MNFKIELEGLGQALEVQSGANGRVSLFIGNEYDNKNTSLFIEDISKVQDQKLYEALKRLEQTLTVNVMLYKEMALELFESEPFIEGSLDSPSEVKEVA